MEALKGRQLDIYSGLRDMVAAVGQTLKNTLMD